MGYLYRPAAERRIFPFQHNSLQDCKTGKEAFHPPGKNYWQNLRAGTFRLYHKFAKVTVLAVVNNVLKSTGANSEYGADIPVADMGIVMKVSQLLTSAVLGLATGILPIFSYNYGSAI